MADLPTRTSPLSIFDRNFDDLFEGFFRPMRGFPQASTGALVPALDVTERPDHYVVQAELPGFNKDDINVWVEGDRLNIQAESSSEREEDREGARALIRERRFGRFSRSLQLGPDVKPDDIKASYKDGVLEVTVPKSEERAPEQKRIEVK